MKLKETFLLMTIGILVAACGSSKDVAGGSDTRYKRKPIVETTDERLKEEAMLIDAKMLQETGQNDESEKRYRQILSIDPACHAAQYELSHLLAMKGMTDSAIVYARWAMEGDKENVWYAIFLANLYRHTNQHEANIRTWETIVQRNPDKLDYYYELSNAHLANNNFKEAISALNRVEKMIGITEEVSLQKAKLWSRSGNEAKALQEIEALANTMPQESRYSSILAESYMSAGKYDKAKMYYDRVLEANPDDEYVHISLAEYYKATQQPRKAYEELRIAMGQTNLSTANKLQILTKFYTSEEFYGIHSSYAYDLLEVAMRGSDDSTSYAAFYGDVLMRQHKYDAAKRQFLLALQADSSKYEVWEALLVSELSSDSDTSAMADHARRAARLFPLHQLPYYVLAIVEHDKGDYAEALKLAMRCEQMGFDKGYLEPETYSLIAECYNRMDDSRCYGYYDKYLALRPNDMVVLNSYAYRLALDKKELDKAEHMSLRTIQAEPENPYYLDTYAWILHQAGKDREALKYIEKSMKHRDSISDEIKEHWKEIKASLGE